MATQNNGYNSYPPPRNPFTADPNNPSPFASSDPNLAGAIGAGGSSPQSGNSFLNFLGTPGGAALTNLVGGGLSAYGQYQQGQQQLKQGALQTAIQQATNQYQNDQANQIARSGGVLNANPLGAMQTFAQKNALLSAILPNLRNFKTTPGDPAVAAAMPQNRGGIMNALGPNGLDPNMVAAMFGPNATMASLTQRQQQLNSLDPNAAQFDMGSMYGSAAAGPQQTVSQWASNLQNLQGAQRAAYEQKVQGYINQMAQQEQNSGGFWHNLAKVAGIVGAAAATIMTAGGAAPSLVAAIGAGSGALGALGNNSNPLMGAILGGTTGYAGAKAKGNG